MLAEDSQETDTPRLGGRYRCERQLGSGASGTVWAAQDEVLERTVAIKALHRREARQEAARRRFLREARLLAGIRHPNVVRVLDFAAEEGEQPYMVMELAEGPSLGERLERGRLPLQDALGLTVKLLRGLAAVHEAGVVHRDLKPDNVLLVDGSPLLIDFGISNADDRSRPPGDTTQAGVIRGTPYYMAPEQARGLPLDPRADLYSVAVLLYELLSDTLPHDGRTAAEVIVAVGGEPPVHLEERCPELESDIVEIVMRGLQRNLDERWQSAAEFADAIEQVQRGASEASVVRASVPPATSGSEGSGAAAASSTVALDGRALEADELDTIPDARPWLLPALLIAVVLVAMATMIGWHFSRTPTDRPETPAASTGEEAVTGGSAPAEISDPSETDPSETDAPETDAPETDPPETDPSDTGLEAGEPSEPPTQARAVGGRRPVVRPDREETPAAAAEEPAEADAPVEEPVVEGDPADDGPRGVVRDPGF